MWVSTRVVNDESPKEEKESEEQNEKRERRVSLFYKNPRSYADISQTFIHSRQSAEPMSTLQHRVKPVHKVPLLDMTDTTDDPTWIDPRSPTANVNR